MPTCDEARKSLSNAQDAVWGKRDAASSARESLSNAEYQSREAHSQWDRLTAALVGRDREVDDLKAAAEAAGQAKSAASAHYKLMLEYENIVKSGGTCPLDGYDDQRPAYREGERERADRALTAATTAKERADKAVTAMETARTRTKGEFDRATTEKERADQAVRTATETSRRAAEALTAAERAVTSAERVVNEVC